MIDTGFPSQIDFSHLNQSIREGLKKEVSLWVLTPPPLESDKKFSIFLDNRPLFENFLEKMFFKSDKNHFF